MDADKDIVDRLPLWKTGPVLREHPGYFLVHERDIDEAAAEIVRLRGEVEALRQCGIKYLGWLGVKDAENGLRKDMADPEMVDQPAPAMPNGVEDMHDDLSTPDLLNEAERIAVNQYKDGRYAAARILRILCHRLRAADNRDAAGVSDDDFVHPEYIRGFNDGAKATPAAAPAGEAECSCDELTQEADGSISGLCSVCLAYLRPKPVQAAPQEGECTSCETEGVFATDGSGPFDCYACGKKAAHHSACELGAVRELVKVWRIAANSASTTNKQDLRPERFIRELESALQHRGDSRGGEGS